MSYPNISARTCMNVCKSIVGSCGIILVCCIVGAGLSNLCAAWDQAMGHAMPAAACRPVYNTLCTCTSLALLTTEGVHVCIRVLHSHGSCNVCAKLVQDVPGLLALKEQVRGPGGSIPSCPASGSICAVFDGWNPGTQPCQVSNCTACTLEQPTCGVFNGNTTTCSWRYVECKNSRVSRIALGRWCMLHIDRISEGFSFSFAVFSN